MGVIVTDKKHYSDIADAIRRKSGHITRKYYPYEMAQSIIDIDTGSGDDEPDIKDIFNHGGVTGLNPYYRRSRMTDNYPDWIGGSSEGYLTFPFSNATYTMLNMECEASTQYDDNQTAVYVGVRSLNSTTMSDRSRRLIPSSGLDISSDSLITRESKTFPRSIVRVSIDVATPGMYFVGWTVVAGYLKIYSIWLE